MIRNIFVCSLLSVVFVFSACNSGNKDETKDDRQLLMAKIDSIQKNMFDKKNQELNKDLAFKGITTYQEFVKKFPEDTAHSPEYLFRTSDLLRAVGDNGKAILTLAQLCKDYPKYKKIPEALFLQGYYYQEFFNDTSSAKDCYNKLIAQFPSHAFSADAKAMMKNFGKTDEQIIKEFEAKNAQKKK